jgi:hypothetical protein
MCPVQWLNLVLHPPDRPIRAKLRVALIVRATIAPWPNAVCDTTRRSPVPKPQNAAKSIHISAALLNPSDFPAFYKVIESLWLSYLWRPKNLHSNVLVEQTLTTLREVLTIHIGSVSHLEKIVYHE